MASITKIGKKGQVIHSQSREIIANVIKFMREEATAGSTTIPLSNFKQRVLAATGISECSYKEIVKESYSITAGTSTSFSSPGKRRLRANTKTDLPDYETDIIRKVVNNFYIHEKKRPTVKCILNKLQECNVPFDGGVSTLNKLLKKIGFRWKKTGDNRKVLMESNNIRALRINYLRQLIRYRSEGREIVYTDETYIHSSHTTPKEWTDGSLQTLKAPVSKGKRFIIVHAGNEKGFVPNALLMFKSGCKSGDYHDDMNHTNFKLWLESQLIPNLPKNSVLVMDNASYHNVKAEKEPTSVSLKKQMCDWLRAKKILFDERMTKPELYTIIRQHKARNPTFAIDAMLAEKGIAVLRLPPYHPELNPIEKIWALVKNWVAQNNVTFKMDDVEALTKQKFASVTAEQWNTVCDHVREVEQDYMDKEHLLDQNYELIFTVNTGESDASDSEYDTDSDSGNDC